MDIEDEYIIVVDYIDENILSYSNNKVLSFGDFLKEYKNIEEKIFVFLKGDVVCFAEIIIKDTDIDYNRCFFITKLPDNANILQDLGFYNIFDSIDSIAFHSSLKKIFSVTAINYRDSENIGLFYFNRNFVIMDVNKYFVEEFKIENKEKFLFKNIRKFFPYVDYGNLKYFQELKTKFVLGDIKEDVVIVFTKFIGEGKNIYFMTIRKDIFWLKKDPREIFTDDHLKDILNNTPDMIMRFNRNYEHIYVNDSVKSELGLSPEDFIGKTHKQMDFPKNLVDRWESAMKKTFDEKKSHAIFFDLESKGELKHYEWRLIPEFNKNGSLETIVTVCRDFTKEKEYRNFSERLSKEISDLQNKLPIGLFNINEKGIIEYVNSVLVEMLGYDNERNLIGINLFDLLKKDIYKEQVSSVIENNKELKNYEIELIKKNGDVVWNSLNLKRNPYHENVIIDCTIMDISIRKEFEKKLQHAQKMEAIGTLTGGIAHDFNNILMAIIGYSEISLQDMDVLHPVYENLEKILISGNRGRDMVKRLLTFSRQTSNNKTEILLQKSIKEALGLLKISFPANVKIVTKIDTSCGYIYADRTQINQVLMNLSINAKYAMKEKNGILELILEKHQQKNDSKIIRAGNYAKLTVKDNGCGMNESVKKHIFEPFYTTKPVNEGTGLGLSTVFNIIKELNGYMTFESVLNVGTEFIVYFPIVKPQFNAKEVVVKKEKLKEGVGNILIVDDEKMVGNLLSKVLIKAGYTVEYFYQSTVALKAFSQDPFKYDLVITDQTMPGITGDKLAINITSIRKEIPIIICSGYTESIPESFLKNNDRMKFIRKPISIGKLTSLVNKMLGN